MGNTCSKSRSEETLRSDSVVPPTLHSDTESPMSSPTPDQMLRGIPEDYEIIETLGTGVYGTVYRCRERKTDQVVAVKTAHPGLSWNLRQEASIFRSIMRHNLDQANIVTYYGELSNCGRFSLMFEALDISMRDYLRMNKGKRMCLKDTRKVIHQLAESFSALKKRKMIHSDLKMDNIMLVNHLKEPFKIKLIDFSLALKAAAPRPLEIQPVAYRAPEIILWLPFSEAIDIWSLGCVMAEMVLGLRLFPTANEVQLLQFIIDLLGPPPPEMMKSLMKGQKFFRMDGKSWLLKTPEKPFVDRRQYFFRNLDDMKMEHLERYNPWEAEDRSQSIELIKAMLKWDPKDRITPDGILSHPFITRNYVKQSVQLPGVIVVQPALPENRIDSTEIGVVGALKSLFPGSKRRKNKKKKLKNKCLQRYHSWVRKKLKLFGFKSETEQRMEEARDVRENKKLNQFILSSMTTTYSQDPLWYKKSLGPFHKARVSYPPSDQRVSRKRRRTKTRTKKEKLKNRYLQSCPSCIRKKCNLLVSKQQQMGEENQLDAECPYRQSDKDFDELCQSVVSPRGTTGRPRPLWLRTSVEPFFKLNLSESPTNQSHSAKGDRKKKKMMKKGETKQRKEDDKSEDVRENNQDLRRTKRGSSHQPLTHQIQNGPKPPTEQTDSCPEFSKEQTDSNPEPPREQTDSWPEFSREQTESNPEPPTQQTDSSLESSNEQTDSSLESSTEQTDTSSEPPRVQTHSEIPSRKPKKKKNCLQRLCSWFRKKLMCGASNPEA